MIKTVECTIRFWPILYCRVSSVVACIQGVGEPPLMLATTVFLAIKDAVSAARADAGLSGAFQLDSPATAERIRMACTDQFTQQVYDQIYAD